MSRDAEQGRLLASLREHPGYKILEARISKRIDSVKADLLKADKTPDMRAIGQLQGEAKALNDLLNGVNSTIKNAPKEADENDV